ncbi:MAG: hypothetical protein KDD45_03340 [Bdellovibrionales bacterium]|nr:hypothetical protein [Bdellovibrionales bacterium]
MECAVLREGLGNSTFAKEDTKVRIKALFDEYLREVEKNLRSIEGLSQEEIRELMQNEVRELVDYLPK